MKLNKDDTILTAYAESAKGPGWSNQPIWVIVYHPPTGEIRRECLQPEDHTPEISALYSVSEAAHRAMTSEVAYKMRGLR